MKATKSAMRAEAAERMKLLRLSESTIEAFRKKKQVLVSDQCSMGRDPDGDGGSDEVRLKDIYLTHGGVVWSLYTTAPSAERLQLIKDAEKEYDVLVYHIQRLELREDMILYAMLFVERNSDEWDYARELITQEMPDCIAPVLGFGGFEVGSLPVKLIDGCLLRVL